VPAAAIVGIRQFPYVHVMLMETLRVRESAPVTDSGPVGHL
jgi:hypothetical protein